MFHWCLSHSLLNSKFYLIINNNDWDPFNITDGSFSVIFNIGIISSIPSISTYVPNYEVTKRGIVTHLNDNHEV